MSMRPSDLRLPGAVDLSTLRPAARPAESPPAADGAVLDVTEATFQSAVLERSLQVPVVVDFWATWCGPCRQLSPLLERLATDAAGAWVLAKIDVDANQRLAAAFRVQSIPTVLAFVGGQPVSGFLGAQPETQVRQWLADVLAGPPAGAEEAAAQPAADPAYDEAEQAVARGDYPAAEAAYRSILERDPADSAARSLLARVQLLERGKGYDERAVRRSAAEDPADLAAALAVADLDMLGGHVEDAFSRLVELIRRTSGEDRDRVRAHLIGLFDVLDPGDARLAAGRRALANALF